MVKTIAIRNPEVISVAAAEVKAGKARNPVEAVENIVLRSKRQNHSEASAPAQPAPEANTQPQAQPA